MVDKTDPTMDEDAPRNINHELFKANFSDNDP
jgi:hypothetical protein